MAIKSTGGENGMSPRKSMAMGKSSMDSEKFGVTPGLYNGGQHPDAKMSHDALEDGNRGVSGGVKYGTDRVMAQAAPDHGPHRVKGMK